MRVYRKFKILDSTWTVKLGSAAEIDSEDACDGLTDFSTHTIYIDESLEGDSFHNTLLHETLHAVFHQSGLNNFTKGLMRKPAEYDERHEDMIRILTPALRMALRNSGWSQPRKKRT